MVEAFRVIATHPIDSPYVVFGHPPNAVLIIVPTPSPSSVRVSPGSSSRLVPTMAERFLWSARCSAKTTNATGTYAVNKVKRYFPVTAFNPSVPPSRNVNLGREI